MSSCTWFVALIVVYASWYFAMVERPANFFVRVAIRMPMEAKFATLSPHNSADVQRLRDETAKAAELRDKLLGRTIPDDIQLSLFHAIH